MFSCFYKSTTKAPSAKLATHLIWIGGPLREKDIKVLSQWKTLNPDHEIYVWIESKLDAEVREQLAGLEITIAHLSTLKIPDFVKNTIHKFINESALLPPNPAAASDLYRFYILDQIGGWYADFDITPFVVANIKINPKYNFFISYPTGDSATSLTPDVIMSHPKSLWTQNAIAYIETAAPIFGDDKIVSLIRSRIASVRLAATENSTGDILSVAASTVLKNGYQIYDSNKRIKIRNKKVFAQISREFHEPGENSWIKRPDIIQDDDYVLGRTVSNFYYRQAIISMINEIEKNAFSLVAKNHSDILHSKNSLKLFKSAIKKATSLENKWVDCIGEYMWTPKEFLKIEPVKVVEEKEEDPVLPAVCKVYKH